MHSGRSLSFLGIVLCAGFLFGEPARAHADLDDQIEAVTGLLAAEPGRADLFLRRGELHRLHGEFIAASADYARAEAIDPGMEGLAVSRAALELDCGRPAAAEARLNSHLGGHPGDARALALRARVRDALGRTGEAAMDREAAARARPRHLDDAGSPAAPAAEILIAAGSSWRYLAVASDPGSAWRDPGASDAGWPSGPAPLGYGDPFIATTVPFGPNAAQKYPTTYFRATFTVPDPGALASLTLRANYDDGFVAWLNGTEIARRSLPAGAVAYATLAGNHEGGAFETVDVTAALPFLVPGANVLAVEVHQTTAASTDLAWDAELTAAEGPRVVRGPYLQTATDRGITIRWRTDLPMTGRVYYGTDPGNMTSFVEEAVSGTEHEVALTGLAPETRTFYAVGNAGEILAGGDSTFAFVTAPAPGTRRPVRIWAVGDSGTKDANAAAVRDGWLSFAAGDRADVWLMLGDNAYTTGTDLEYQAAVFDMYPTILRNTPLWPTRGNHDQIYSGSGNDYYDHFTLPAAGQAGGVASGTEAWYSFDHGRVHFVCLDSEGSDRSVSGSMLTWLQQDLAATDADWVIAFWHHPPYTKGSHDSDNGADSGGRMRDMRQNALPLLESGGVDLVLTGHSHSYERSCLLDGHYGVSSTLLYSMRLDPGDGDPAGDGAYGKPSGGQAPHEGSVYVVAGSSGQTDGGPLNHPVMAASLDLLGSLVIDVEGGQLDGSFIGTAGNVLDAFTIVKGNPVAVPGDGNRPPAFPVAAFPNPFSLSTRIRFHARTAGAVRIAIHDAAGRRVRALLDGRREAGDHEIVWDGRDDAGRMLPAGVYFSVVVAAGETRSRKIVLSR